MKVKLWIDTGFVGCEIEDEIEVPNNTSEEELQKRAEQFLFENIDYGWSFEED